MSKTGVLSPPTVGVFFKVSMSCLQGYLTTILVLCLKAHMPHKDPPRHWHQKRHWHQWTTSKDRVNNLATIYMTTKRMSVSSSNPYKQARHYCKSMQYEGQSKTEHTDLQKHHQCELVSSWSLIPHGQLMSNQRAVRQECHCPNTAPLSSANRGLSVTTPCFLRQNLITPCRPAVPCRAHSRPFLASLSELSSSRQLLFLVPFGYLPASAFIPRSLSSRPTSSASSCVDQSTGRQGAKARGLPNKCLRHMLTKSFGQIWF